jgi:hypothetical protein
MQHVFKSALQKDARIPAHVATGSVVATEDDVLQDGVFQVRFYHQFGQEIGTLIPALNGSTF